MLVSSEADNSTGLRGRILLADDDEGVRGPIGRLLNSEGYLVTSVATGDEAAHALVGGEYDLLITDINMPGNRELELLHSRDEETSGVPVIVITGYPTVPTAVEALRLAVIDYLIKPLDLEHLLDRVAKAVEKGRALRAVRKAQEDATTWTMWLHSMKTALDTPGTISLPAQPPSAEPAQNREAYDADVLRRLPPEEYDSLSPREREVLREIASGRRVGDVAGTLHISPHTVRNHLKSIFRKLGVHSQVALLGKLTRQASPHHPEPQEG